jgi:hypothetical protein
MGDGLGNCLTLTPFTTTGGGLAGPVTVVAPHGTTVKIYVYGAAWKPVASET